MPALDSDDLPAVDPDFAFDTLAARLVRVLGLRRSTAFVLGLHGPWGSGKTTLLNAIRKRLPGGDIVVDFNAWKYRDREALWRALILAVLGALERNGGDKDKIVDLQRSLYQAFTVTDRGPLTMNWTAAVTESLLAVVSAASLGIGGGWLKSIASGITKVFSIGTESEQAKDAADRVERVAKVFERRTIERAVQQVASIEQFLEKFRAIVSELGKGRRVYVLIDDLDRCLPDSALEIFEAVKLFLDAPECSYAIAVDRAVIRRGLELRYPRRSGVVAPPVVDPDEYIEKTITLSFDLPMLAEADGRKLVLEFGPTEFLDETRVSKIVDVLGTNPRRLKRFSSMLRLWTEIANDVGGLEETKLRFSPVKADNRDLFVKLTLIAYLNSALITQMQRDLPLSDRLQRAFNAATAKATPFEAQQSLNSLVTLELPVIREAVLEPALLRAMTLAPNLVGEPKLMEALRWFRSAAT